MKRPKRDNCIACGKTWAELGIRYVTNRQVCYSKQCRKRLDELNKEAPQEEQDDWHAGRVQGAFLIPATERGQSRALTESFFCWVCHAEHRADEVTKTLGLSCVCGVIYAFTIGTTESGSHIVRVDRFK